MQAGLLTVHSNGIANWTNARTRSNRIRGWSVVWSILSLMWYREPGKRLMRSEINVSKLVHPWISDCYSLCYHAWLPLTTLHFGLTLPTRHPLTDGAGGYTGDFTCTLAKNLGLGLILTRPTTASDTNGIAAVDVLCRFCDPGTPTEVDLALIDVRVFLTMLSHFARLVRTLISA